MTIKTNVLGLYRSHVNKDVCRTTFGLLRESPATSRPRSIAALRPARKNVHRNRMHLAAVVDVRALVFAACLAAAGCSSARRRAGGIAPTPSCSTARSSSTTRRPRRRWRCAMARSPRSGAPPRFVRWPVLDPRHRSRRPHRHPRADRFPYPRHPRRADLHHRGAMDRRSHAGRSPRPHPRGGSARRKAPG